MCGIAGIIDFRSRPIDEAALQRFCDALGHRGPDDRGIWRHESPSLTIGLAHTRLAVIDPTPEGHQPMIDPTGRFVVSYNGELYNYRALRSELPVTCRTDCDTEVILQACACWGHEALNRFDAMWALAFVDNVEHTGHLSRDPVGIKPLYYVYHDDRLIFASELRALLTVGDLPLEIDRDALGLYLYLGYIPHPYTIYKSVRKLPPGCRLDFDASGPKTPVSFYALPETSKTPIPYKEACGELRKRIETAVVDQRIADVPLGAFLSGGLDSSIVVGCLSQAGEKVKTFSIGYEGHSRYDETDYARRVARHFNTEHRAFRLSFRDIIETVEPTLDHLSEPFADSSLLPTALVSRYTREHVTVALSGDGGDELFGGYWRYLGHHYLQRYKRWPAFLRKGVIEPLLALAPDARSTPRLDRIRQIKKLLRGDLPNAIDRHIAWAVQMDNALAQDLIGAKAAQAATETVRDIYHAAACRLREPPDMNDVLRTDLTIGLPGDMLCKVDTAGMAHSLEVRVPLLSRKVVDFVAQLPIEYKIDGAVTKRILKDAFKDLIPSDIIERKKMGFEVPVGEFLRNELADMYNDTVTPSPLRDLGLNPQTAQRIYNEHKAQKKDHSQLLWSLMVLCRWQNRRSYASH